VLVGCRSVAQLEENVAALSWRLDPQAIAKIRKRLIEYGL